MRISDLAAGAALLLLAACSSRKAPDPVSAAPDDARIECSVGGTPGFSRDCSVEQLGDNGDELVLHHRDGGFRRLRVSPDGRGMIAADGSEQPVVSLLADKRIEVALGADRYRLPAAMAP